MKIGDVTPWPKDLTFDPEAIRAALRQRRRDQAMLSRPRAPGRSGTLHSQNRVNRAEAARLVDPFEQARAFLGKLGIPVYSWAVYHEDFREDTARRLIAASPWVVGSETVSTREGVMAKAHEHGWPGPDSGEERA